MDFGGLRRYRSEGRGSRGCAPGCTSFGLAAEPSGAELTNRPAHEPVEADVQMALILDTSSSMDGLILQARTQILDIVGDLQTTEDGSERTVAVALYRYGTDRVPEREGYTECLVPLTTDYARVVQALELLQASGSEEYAPFAIDKAVSELAWDIDPKVPKVIVIVGNETFSAGPVGTDSAFQAARAKTIKVLPIYCVGQHASTSAVSGWRRAAHLAGTDLEVIDPNATLETLDEPTDHLTPVQMKRSPVHPKPELKYHRAHSPTSSDRVGTPSSQSGYPVAGAPRMKELPSYKPDLSTGVRQGLKGALKGY